MLRQRRREIGWSTNTTADWEWNPRKEAAEEKPNEKVQMYIWKAVFIRRMFRVLIRCYGLYTCYRVLSEAETWIVWLNQSENSSHRIMIKVNRSTVPSKWQEMHILLKLPQSFICKYDFITSYISLFKLSQKMTDQWSAMTSRNIAINL